MRGRTDIGLADIVHAWRALGAVTDADRRAVVRVLGFDLPAATDPEEGTGPEEAGPDDVAPAIPREGPTAVEPEEGPSQHSESLATPIYLTPLDPIVDNEAELPIEGIARPGRGIALPLESLFAAGWARVISGTLTARTAPVGAIDVEGVVDALARRRLLRSMPRRDRLVSATQIIVVVDVRGTIAWFREDADQLIKRLDAVTRYPISTVISEGVPGLTTDMVPTGDWSEEVTIRVGAGSRVIVISDLGLGASRGRGDPARTRRWIGFMTDMRARSASVVIVTPVPPVRIPAAIRRTAACVYWDASTRPGTVHRRIKELE